jgi:TonB family protein
VVILATSVVLLGSLQSHSQETPSYRTMGGSVLNAPGEAPSNINWSKCGPVKMRSSILAPAFPIDGVYRIFVGNDGVVTDKATITSAGNPDWDEAIIEHYVHCLNESANVIGANSDAWIRFKFVTGFSPFPSCRLPQYPKEALQARLQGTGVYEFFVGVDGKVQDSRVKISAGSDLLDRAVTTALSECAFSPAKVEGKFIASWRQMKYTWKLP